MRELDRGFDPDDPDWLIDPQFCHTLCETREAVIGAGESATSWP